jgi:hypothetical protein
MTLSEEQPFLPAYVSIFTAECSMEITISVDYSLYYYLLLKDNSETLTKSLPATQKTCGIGGF